MPSTYEREGFVSDAEDDFLSHLPPDTAIFHYNPHFPLESLIPPISQYDSFVVIKGFPSKTLDELDEEIPGRLDYFSPLQTLVLQLPSLPHEEAAGNFAAMIAILADQMKVKRRISCIGSTSIDGEDRKKQADRAWKPILQEEIFPTVALEVSYSHSAAKKLERDVCWWLHESRGRMKMGITIDIKRSSGNIEIKSWIPARRLPRHINITAHGRQVIDKESESQSPVEVGQRILIKKGGNGKESTITGGDLIIPFQSLLLTEPAEGECDFVFTEDILLHDIAEKVWIGIEKEKERAYRKS